MRIRSVQNEKQPCVNQRRSAKSPGLGAATMITGRSGERRARHKQKNR
jgi:hypothetical protein